MYSYAGNNPTTNTDPSGLYCVNSNGGWHDDDSGGESCADVMKNNAAEEAHPSTTVRAKPGNALADVGANFFLALDKAANDTFAPFVGRPSYMQNIPTGRGFWAEVGAGAAIVGTAIIGPEGEAGDGIAIAEGRLTKVLEAHTVGGRLVTGTKSLFENPDEVRGLIKAAESVTPVEQAGGNLERIVNAGRVIGTDRNTGQPTSIYTVITNRSGNLITLLHFQAGPVDCRELIWDSILY